MSAHDTAITASARAIRKRRYLVATVSDEELAEVVVPEYFKNLPPRRPRVRPKRTAPVAASEPA